MLNHTATPLYLPTIERQHFVPLPDEVDYTHMGKPQDYRFALFCLPALGLQEYQDVAGRLLLALSDHGTWSAVTHEGLRSSIAYEDTARRCQISPYYPISVLSGLRGYHKIMEAVQAMASAGWIGFDESTRCMWPTPTLLERLVHHRVPVTPSQVAAATT